MDLDTYSENAELVDNPYNEDPRPEVKPVKIPAHLLVFPKAKAKKPYIDDEMEAHRATRDY